jgi:hypothetical protein
MVNGTIRYALKKQNGIKYNKKFVKVIFGQSLIGGVHPVTAWPE